MSYIRTEHILVIYSINVVIQNDNIDHWLTDKNTRTLINEITITQKQTICGSIYVRFRFRCKNSWCMHLGVHVLSDESQSSQTPCCSVFTQRIVLMIDK